MKILVYGINYSPDLIGIAKYTTEMCMYLSQRGHEVRVVTAPPYYPAWRIKRPYRGYAYTSEVQDNIKVLRCPLFVPKSPRARDRILHHLSFALFSAPVLVAEALRFRPDVVLSIAPSLMGTPAAVVAGKLSGAATWLHIQDFEVDAAFSMGMLAGSRFRRAALWLESRLLRAVDGVSAISTKMVDALLSKGVPRSRIAEFRNWVDISGITRMKESDAAAREIEIMRSSLLPEGASVMALYAGSMAMKQGLEILAETARSLADSRPDIGFVFCGSGVVKDRLKQSTEGLPNVRFLDLQPVEVFSRLLVSADIHLLPQCLEIQDLVLPSKLGGMLASGRPVVAMAHGGTQLASELVNVGLVIPPADVEALKSALVRLADDSELRHNLGDQGQQLARRRWDREVVLSELESRLQEFRLKRRRRSKAPRATDPVRPVSLN